MIVIYDGIFIVYKLLHKLKDYSFISVIVSGNTKLVKLQL